MPSATPTVPSLLKPPACLCPQVCVGQLLSRYADALEAAPSLQPLQAQWLFALCSVLQKPVHADVGACLRSLMRRVAALRAQGLSGPDDPQLPVLNSVAAVVGAYFGQDPDLIRHTADLELP